MRPIIALLCLLCAACANPYSKFYKGVPDARAFPAYIASDEKIAIYSTNDFDRDIRALERKGYMPIGSSSFNGTADAGQEGNLLAQAQKVGAHVVLVASRYTNTISGAVPLVLPNNTTSYSSGSATAYGSGGSATAYGTSTTTTYGTQTVLMPYQTQRFDFSAVYLAKGKSRAGIVVKALDDETRRKLQSNRGVVVDLVMEETPGFLADVLPGDIILSLNDSPVFSEDGYKAALERFEGSNVDFEISRDGQIIHKTIGVLSYGAPPGESGGQTTR